MIGFIGVQYSAYQNDIRAYDACVDLVYRSEGTKEFNETLIDIVDREVSGKPYIGEELRAAMLPPIDISTCGSEPSFISHLKDS